MRWDELVKVTLGRPGMWGGRPWIDGALTLWHGYALGAGDGNFERFCNWLATDRFPVGGHRNSLAANAIIRKAVTGETFGSLSEEEDQRAIELLAALVDEFRRSS